MFFKGTVLEISLKVAYQPWAFMYQTGKAICKSSSQNLTFCGLTPQIQALTNQALVSHFITGSEEQTEYFHIDRYSTAEFFEALIMYSQS